MSRYHSNNNNNFSTLSANLNCLAGTIYEDFVSKIVTKNISPKTSSNILKVIVILTGILCTALVFAIEHMGGLLTLSISFHAVTQGPMLAMFTLGMLFPKANSKVSILVKMIWFVKILV